MPIVVQYNTNIYQHVCNICPLPVYMLFQFPAAVLFIAAWRNALNAVYIFCMFTLYNIYTLRCITTLKYLNNEVSILIFAVENVENVENTRPTPCSTNLKDGEINYMFI